MADETLQTATETVEKNADALIDRAKTAVDDALEGSKSFLGKAQEALSDVVDRTVEAVKENPKIAAGIAAGAVATVAGGAYAVSKLRADEPAKPRAPRKTAAKSAPKK